MLSVWNRVWNTVWNMVSKQTKIKTLVGVGLNKVEGGWKIACKIAFKIGCKIRIIHVIL